MAFFLTSSLIAAFLIASRRVVPQRESPIECYRAQKLARRFPGVTIRPIRVLEPVSRMSLNAVDRDSIVWCVLSDHSIRLSHKILRNMETYHRIIENYLRLTDITCSAFFSPLQAGEESS